MDGATTVHVHVTLVILQHGTPTPGSDDTAPTGDVRAEARTRQEHAADDPADTAATDG